VTDDFSAYPKAIAKHEVFRRMILGIVVTALDNLPEYRH